jgi:hypothetical protein
MQLRPSRYRRNGFVPRPAELGDFGIGIPECLFLKNTSELANDRVVDLLGRDRQLGAISREPNEHNAPFGDGYKDEKFFPDLPRPGEKPERRL